MSFVHPWVLLLVPLLLLWWFFKRRPVPGMKIPSLNLWEHVGPGRTRLLWLPRGLRLMALLMLVVALARPQAGSERSMQVSEGIAIELLVDVSSSMDMTIEARDGPKRTRMEVAKELVEAFIGGDGDKLGGRDGDLIGLITFARYADTRSPLTFGHPALLQLVKGLTVQERPNEDGTAYGDALALAAARLKHLDEMKSDGSWAFAGEVASRVIILLTDGENNSGAHLPIEAAGLAKKWNCRVYCISLGDASSSSQTAVPGERVLGPADQLLEHIALETGGLFRKAFDYQSLKAVYEEIDQLERSAISTRNFNEVSEWFWLPVALAVGALAMGLILEATYLRIAP